MANQRAAGQTLIAFPLDEKFLAEVDSARGETSRSAFVREALRNYLVAKGHPIPRDLTAAPDRAGKGGRKSKITPMDPGLGKVAEDSVPSESAKAPRKNVNYRDATRKKKP